MTDVDRLKKIAKGEQENPIVKALFLLAGSDEDHATQDNGLGFNKNDSEEGHLLASKAQEGTLTSEDLKAARKIVLKYKAQLGPKLTDAIRNFKIPKSEKSDARSMKQLNGQFFSTPQGLKFYVENGAIPLEIEGEGFEGLLADRTYLSEDRLPSGEEISNVRRLARYWASKNVRDIGVRVARAGDGFIYDPVNEEGTLYFIDSSSTTLEVPDEPYTVRYPGMLEAEVSEGNLEDHLALVRLWRLNPETEILSMGLDFARFVPGIPQAIETVDGPHGSGKTSYTETKRMLFDPNGAPTQALKYDERDLSISAIHQGMLAFDNVNSAIPDYISDVVCRFTTGQGFRTRELYTNTGEIILKLRRPIIINGINRVSYRADFLDRECPIHLGVMPEDERITDLEIRRRAEDLIPKVRGFILSIMPAAIRFYSQVEAELRGKLPRMADFVIWAECGIRAMGLPDMSFYNAYVKAKHNETLDVARDTLLITAIQGLLAGRDEWRGTTKDLLESLEDLVTENERKSKTFPKDERRLGRVLRELLPTLREIGIEVIETGNNKHEKIIKKIISAGQTYKGNSTNSTNTFDLRKYGTGESEINENTNFDKKLIAQQDEPVNDSVQSKSANSAINHDELPHEKSISDDKKSQPDPSKQQSESENSLSGLRREVLRLMEIEAPKLKYRSLTPKALFDLLPHDFAEYSLSEISQLLESLTSEGVLLKSGIGYRINVEWQNGGGDFE